MKELELRRLVVTTAQAWLGCKESNGTHKQIIDLYNTQTPLPRGYKVRYTDAWCATFVTAVGVKLGITDIILPECGCGNMVALYQRAGQWMEDDSYTPAPGDVIFYDWQDDGKGDNKGAPDHVGIVCAVSAGKITVIEGNKSNAVGYRSININGKYIRGFGLPDYASKANKMGAVNAAPAADTTVATPVPTPGGRKLQYARAFNKSVAGTYKVEAKSGLNLRYGAGVDYDSIKLLPDGATVRCYGYFTEIGGVKWLYINASGSLGFASSKYLTKKA